MEISEFREILRNFHFPKNMPVTHLDGDVNLFVLDFTTFKVTLMLETDYGYDEIHGWNIIMIPSSKEDVAITVGYVDIHDSFERLEGYDTFMVHVIKSLIEYSEY